MLCGELQLLRESRPRRSFLSAVMVPLCADAAVVVARRRTGSECRVGAIGVLLCVASFCLFAAER